MILPLKALFRCALAVCCACMLYKIVLGRPAAASTAPPSDRSWAPFVEPAFPFFGSVLDARGAGGETNNLTPRGLILNLGHEAWACFDVDLLRVTAIWRGEAVTPVSMAQGSYHVAGHKAPEGQRALPGPRGPCWITTGIHPGWIAGPVPDLADPRPRDPDPREVGRGPLPRAFGRFRAIGIEADGARLEYEVAGYAVRERIRAEEREGALRVVRRIELEPVRTNLWLIVGSAGANAAIRVVVEPEDDSIGGARVEQVRREERFMVRVPPSERAIRFEVRIERTSRSASEPVRGPAVPAGAPPGRDGSRAGPRWPETVVTAARLAPATNAYVVDSIEPPFDNPWRRNVRLADIGFFPDGRAALVTFDGDVWLATGLEGDLQNVRWSRFTSGFHEPLGLCIRRGEVFVHDRNGIWRVIDSDGDGEADQHELFSSAFTQTAETREFASGLRVLPDGSFVIGKGGQRGDTLSRHSGTVLRIAPDGESVEMLGRGLRQPFIGVHPLDGRVTASDQQGHYVPTTALHVLGRNAWHGFHPLILKDPEDPEPIPDPLTWIPHPVNASGAGQVWLTDARMGPLAGCLVHLGYYRPEAFVVRLNDRGSSPQAAVTSLTRAFDFPPLFGAVNPADGQLYVTGFQIWGTTAPRVSGLARIRYTGRPFHLPAEVIPMTEGVLVRFHESLDPATASSPANYSAERWNYRRSAQYGSAHYRLDGSRGQETLTPSSVYLSRDRRAVFVAIPDMRPVMQMRLGWTIASRDGGPVVHNTWFTPRFLPKFDPPAEGFDPIAVDLTPRAAAVVNSSPVTAEEGRRLSELMGCVACHSTDGSVLGRVGPSWKGLFGSRRELAGGEVVRADEEYLREAIRDPAAKVVRGYELSDAGMPSYEGILTESQVEALVAYIRTLR